MLFSFLVLFANQPMEQGTLVLAGKKDDVSARFLQSRQSGQSRPSFPLSIAFEKKKDGSDSMVYMIRSLPEFLFVYFDQAKPVFLKMSPNPDAFKDTFQTLAEEVGSKAVFMSIDTRQDSNLVRLFNLLLRVQGISIMGEKAQNLLFLCCKKGFVQMQKKGVLNFNKAALIVLKPDRSGRITEKQVHAHIE